MPKRFLTPVGLLSATSDPSSASTGNIYFNSASNVIRVYYNSTWNTTSSSAITSSSATISASSNTTASFGGQSPSYYLDTSSTAQTKSGQLSVASAIFGASPGLFVGIGDAAYAGTASGAAMQLASGTGSRAIRFYTPNSSGTNGIRLFVSDSNVSVWSPLFISPTFSVRSSVLTASTEVFGVDMSTGLSTASALSVFGPITSSGNLNVDSGTLFVDATNNEVGVLTTSPASALHVAGGLLVTGSALVNGTITGTSTTKAAGDSSTSLATTAFVSNMIRYNGAFSGSTSSVAGFFVIPVSPGTSLNGCLMMSRGTAARFFNGEVNLGINGAASAGYIRGVATNSAGTAIAVNTSVPCFYIAW